MQSAVLIANTMLYTERKYLIMLQFLLAPMVFALTNTFLIYLALRFLCDRYTNSGLHRQILVEKEQYLCCL